jgi:replicative superfamily II helicase
MEHTTGQSLGSLAERYDCYPMDLSILKRNCDWMLATAQRIFAYRWRQAWILEGDEQSDEKRPLCTHEKRLQQLIPMIKYGLPAETCELVKVKGIGPKRALALLTNDIKTLKRAFHCPNRKLNCSHRVASTALHDLPEFSQKNPGSRSKVPSF